MYYVFLPLDKTNVHTFFKYIVSGWPDYLMMLYFLISFGQLASVKRPIAGRTNLLNNYFRRVEV